MNIKDREIIRELAKRYMELASSDKQKKAFKRMQDTNDLKLVRPPVLLDEIPWYQMNIDNKLTLLCTEEKARSIEEFLRRALYRWEYFKADNLNEPFYRVWKAYDSTGTGLEVEESILRTDATNNIVSHSYTDILADEEVLEKMHMPKFSLRPDIDEENMNYYTELLGDTMPVKLCGHRYVYFMPWDIIARYRGMDSIYIDLYDRPEYMHKIIDKFCKAMITELDFFEKNSCIETSQTNLHCTPAMVSGLGDEGWKGTWFRGGAQGFGSVSPAMHKEFELDYIKPLAERFGYTYYGCCEPLDNKMDVIKEIKNLRKIGVSPWANVESSAEQIGGNYVFARKPNPANVSSITDPEVIRKEIEESAKACIKYGCPCEFVLKDISTVSNRPENLIVWAKTVSDVLDEYYGKED